MAPKSHPTSPKNQQTISSFFSRKRKSSPIDLTANDSDDTLPPTKKQKGSEATSPYFRRDAGHRETTVPSFLRQGTFCDDNPQPDSSKVPRGDRDPNRWRFSPKSFEDVHTESSRRKDNSKGETPLVKRSLFREKVKQRESARREKEASHLSDTPLEEISSYTSDNEIEEDTADSGADKLKKYAAGNTLVWEKGNNSRKNRKKISIIGPQGLPCTPLEEVVIQFKKKYPDTVLLIEVGYKYCFFGEDAKIAGKVLGFFYGMDRNFLRTSCPVNNLKPNVKKLVAAGHKVGVVNQVETAALKKAGDNRNTLFERELSRLYTPSTFVDALDSNDEFVQSAPPLMCIVEQSRGSASSNDKFLFGIISIVPSTGDVVYDEFQDTFLRTELETRLVHTRPCELLLPSRLSKPTENMLTHFAQHGHAGKIRVERIDFQFDYSKSFDYITKTFEKDTNQIGSAIAGLSELVVVALALALKHLSAFGLSDALLQTHFFHKFRTRAHMLLNTTTIRNLEIYQNQTDFTEKGTFFSVLNQTTTAFGKRLLKSWVGRPLVDKCILQQRVDAVEEARLGMTPKLILLRDLLKGLPDLARGLGGIQYRRSTPKELLTFLSAMDRIGATFPAFSTPSDVGCQSAMWTDIIFALPALKASTKELLGLINLPAARENRKTDLWKDSEHFPSIEEIQVAVMAVESDLAEELKKIRKLLKMPSLKYVSVLNDEFLVEVSKECVSIVPPNWVRIASTKHVVRYRTPEVLLLVQEREQHKEALQAEADKAYQSFLRDIAEQHYTLFRDVVNKLATADCLMSLAMISLNGDFCKPTFVSENLISIEDGRHPIIEQVRSEPFVPNAISLGGDSPGNLIITGPNMGGKTSVVKLVALLVLMAQMGSYVPAKRMSLSMHDAVLTRMGASDDLAAGRSTFMVEIAETRDIIESATSNSLVILDELGVGTSTFDGMAIAGAVLEHLCQEVKCRTLFITHYPTLARELEARHPQTIGNRHMGFIEDTRIDGRREIRFLYQLTDGISKGSFGIECGRLAGLPESLLEQAERKASTMREIMGKRLRNANAKNMLRLLRQCVSADNAALSIQGVKTQMKIMIL